MVMLVYRRVVVNHLNNPRCSMVPHIHLKNWAIFGVNVGKYEIHGASGKRLFYGQFDGGVMGVEWDLRKDSMRFNGNLMGIDGN